MRFIARPAIQTALHSVQHRTASNTARARASATLRRSASTARQSVSGVATMPQLHLGVMTFGWSQSSSPVDDTVASAFLDQFTKAGHVNIDSARIYAGGDTEDMLGRVLTADMRSKLTIASKAHPSQPGGLSEEGMKLQLQATLEAVGTDSIDVLYLHQPDTQNDLIESITCIHSLIQQGKVKAWGLSNFSAVETARCLKLCTEHGLVKPSVYQGLYNPINRRVEADLLPILRQNQIAFVAYNPLAAGLLTGKHKMTSPEEAPQGRFKNNPNYLDRFYKEPDMKGMELVRQACDGAGISMVQATYSWMLHHSQLTEANDGLLLGASSIAQLTDNLQACEKASALPDEVVAAFDQAWGLSRPHAFAFWRSYSKDMPNAPQLDQGASYNAAKTKAK